MLWNCEDQTSENLSENSKLNSLLNTHLISQELGLGEDNIVIKWNEPSVLSLDKNNQGGVYQYAIEQKEPILNNSNLFVEKLTFKLVVKEQEGVIEDIQILRYQPFKESLNTSPSELNIEDFSGMKFIFNKLGQMQDIYTYLKGKKISSFNETKSERTGKYKDILYPKADGSDFNECLDLNGKPIEGCISSAGPGSGGGGGYVTETTHYYTDWYNRCDTCTSNDGIIYNHTDGNKYVYIKTTYNGSSTRWVWVSNGGNRYVDYFNSRTGGGATGPNFNDDEQRNYVGSNDNEIANQLPCPIGFEKVGDNCVKIAESYDDQIINKLTDKAKCVYDKLEINSLLKKTLERFKGKTPTNLILNQKSNLTVKDKNGNDILVNAYTDYGLSYNITITLNTEQSKNRPSLAVARTILHEAIHADIFRKIKTTSQIKYDPYTKTYSLPNGSRANFPSLFDAYNEDPKNPYHNYMAQYYREALELGLKEYATSIGETHSDQFYKDMAWYGLLDTKAWDKQYADKAYADKEKTRIKKANSNYEKSKSNECK